MDFSKNSGFPPKSSIKKLGFPLFSPSILCPPRYFWVHTHTPWKIKMEPTKQPFRKENDLNQTSEDMFQPLIFRGVFQSCERYTPNLALLFHPTGCVFGWFQPHLFFVNQTPRGHCRTFGAGEEDFPQKTKTCLVGDWRLQPIPMDPITFSDDDWGV